MLSATRGTNYDCVFSYLLLLLLVLLAISCLWRHHGGTHGDSSDIAAALQTLCWRLCGGRLGCRSGGRARRARRV